MSDKYFITIAKEKYDCSYQEMQYLGIYDCFSLALEHIKTHNKSNYIMGIREFDYYIFASNVNYKIIMKEEECIYSLTGKMYDDKYEEYIAEEYKHYLDKTV